MNFAKHPDFKVHKLALGRERAPLLVIDNLMADAESLVDLAAKKMFGDVVTYYPGVRAKVPLSYQQFVLEHFGPLIVEYFGLSEARLRFTDCHFSLVTTPPEKLEYLQRTEAFFQKYGPMTIVLSRFLPILRTCAPFVAGVARMPYARFQAYNFAGGIAWVLSFVWLGYFFGNLPLIKENFGLVTIGIIVVSTIPAFVVVLRK